MSFMEPQITDKQQWAEVDTSQGTVYIPIDEMGIKLPEWDESTEQGDRWERKAIKILRDYLPPGKVFSVSEREGYGARLSAPGYLDCTEWAIFDTEQEARDYLEETYGDE